MKYNPIRPSNPRDVSIEDRPEGVVNRTVRNPQGSMQFEFTGTPKNVDNGFDEDGQSIASRAMLKSAITSDLCKRIETLIRTDMDTYLPMFEKAFADAANS